MIDVQLQKNRISEIAIRGLLTPNFAIDESIDDIVLEIRKERDNLLQQGKTKAAKVSDILDDLPFEVPENWRWVALGDLCILISRGKSPTYSEVRKYPVFAQKCNQPNHLALEKALFLDESTIEKWPEFFRLRNADIVVNSTGTGTVGRVGYYVSELLDPQYEFMVPDSHVTVLRTGKKIVSKYLYYALRTNTLQTIMQNTFRGSTNQKEFYIDSVYSIPIPLPPFQEQRMIVSILDSVFMQLNIIDDLQKQYENNVEVLKKKIIDAGIRGQLTEQFPEDGDAETLYAQIQEEKVKLIKEGKLKKEKEPLPIYDDVPYMLPDNWLWVRLGTLGASVDNAFADGPFGSNLKTEHYTSEKQVRIIQLSNIGSNGWKNDNEKYTTFEHLKTIQRSEVKNGDIVIAKMMPAGRAIVVPDVSTSYVLSSDCVKFVPNSLLDSNYLCYAINSNMFHEQVLVDVHGIGRERTSLTNLKRYIVPLPPLPVQKRIVERIDSLLACLA